MKKDEQAELLTWTEVLIIQQYYTTYYMKGCIILKYGDKKKHTYIRFRVASDFAQECGIGALHEFEVLESLFKPWWCCLSQWNLGESLVITRHLYWCCHTSISELNLMLKVCLKLGHLEWQLKARYRNSLSHAVSNRLGVKD